MQVAQKWQRWILMGILLVALGFLTLVNIQQFAWRPHLDEHWYEQAFWPRYAAWWAKAAMWSCVGLMGFLHRRWEWRSFQKGWRVTRRPCFFALISPPPSLPRQGGGIKYIKILRFDQNDNKFC